MNRHSSREFQIAKCGWSYQVEGPGEGWVFEKKYSRKWRAKIAIEVFCEGGRVSDYWRRARDEKPPIRYATRAYDEIEKLCSEIIELDPSTDDIEGFGRLDIYGTVTQSKSKDYFPPRVHDTWGEKSGGRVHIDLGWNGYHLMLDRTYARVFIEFIQERRKSEAQSQH